ncbi:CHAT domain-containing tetratricopeptide repeat protein [Leptolyngbya sp. FACHB-321]|uniref:CHAT domain-containing tetratricopeptide repeat protein n=1 Tax=Leptolyngbya sp. FACHB-321 TaxID=2692807 RepID=UPI0018EF608E|nr:CHAT domain-containing tetratricopeptide repeat protein [Leptolyngbya sp. FACHB-321]
MKRQWLELGAIPLLVAIALPLGVSAQSASTAAKLEHSKNIDASAVDRLMQQGNQAYQVGQLEAAVKLWQQARTAYQPLQNRVGEAIALANLGAVYVALERYRDAIAALEAFLPLAHSLGNRQGEAQALGNLGIAYKELGNYNQALRSHRQAGKLMRLLGDRAGLGQVLVNLGNVFEALGDYENATIAYEQSLNLAQQRGDRAGEGVAQGNLGGVYANLGQHDKAIIAQTNSLALAKATGNREGQASTLINLGTAYHVRNDYKRAISYYNESLTISQRINSRKRTAEALSSLGLAYEDLKDYPKAINYYEQSVAIAQQLNDPQLEGLTLNNLGHALFGAGKLAEAEQRLRSAIQLLDALRPGLNDTYKASIFDTQIYTYNLLQQILLAAQKPEAALEITEHGRARAFVELLAQRLPGGGSESAKGADAGDESEPNGQEPNQLPGANNAALAVQPITIAAIKAVARQQNATLVEYAIVPDDDFKVQGKQRAREAELLIWVVQPTGEVAVRRVDLKPLWQNGVTLVDAVRLARCLTPQPLCRDLAQKVRGLESVEPLQSTPTSSSSIARTDQRRQQPGLRKLHQLLIEPIADLLPRNPSARLVFIPQEALFLVPFVALQDANGNYLIENHTILTAPAIQVLELTRKQRESQGNERGQFLLSSTPSQRSTPGTLVVGNPTMPSVSAAPGEPPEPLPPLPESEKEAIAIAQLLGTQVLTGNQATKVSILKKLPAARLIHFATHGLLEYGSQSASLEGLGVPGAIALAPSNNDDGLLTTSEVLNLRLTAELVTLSACDTGQGRITGDGVIGLSRAFVAAGVPSVIVSLWAVPDAATAKLMTTFYQTLQQQPDKAQALRQAMLITMKDYPDPVDWAAFTLIGEAG